jgi:hypothetical protein
MILAYLNEKQPVFSLYIIVFVEERFVAKTTPQNAPQPLGQTDNDCRGASIAYLLG